jgi:hypothetical protein
MRPALIVALLIIAGAMAWELVPFESTIWDGHFYLTVHVGSTAGPLRTVSCQAFSRQEDAEYALELLLPPESPLWSAVADPFNGQTLRVDVPVSGRTSPLGRELRRSQFRHLLVIGQLQDGKRVGMLVEIPDSRLTREVHVSLP